MHGCKIKLPLGKNFMLFYDGEEDRNLILTNGILNNWSAYCEANWLNLGRNDLITPENKVKWFLDGCGNFLLYGRSEGIISSFKHSSNASRELPVSSCPADVSGLLYSSNTYKPEGSEYYGNMIESLPDIPAKRKKKVSKPKKSIKDKAHPIAICKVNTEGIFLVGRKRYKVADTIFEYGVKDTKNDFYFLMDTIYVQHKDGSLNYYDMSFNEIPQEVIIEIKE